MKLETQNFCPHCNSHTDTFMLELEKCAIYVCMKCGKEPTEKEEPVDTYISKPEDIEKYLILRKKIFD